MSTERFFTRLDWDSEFFGRPMFGAELSGDFNEDALERVHSELLEMAADPKSIFQIRLRSTQFHLIPMFEDLGFRFVDSRLEFHTLTRREDFSNAGSLPFGQLRWFRDDDLAAIEALTKSQFSSNPAFRSRFNNRRYFSEAESHSYYMAWHRLALQNDHPMFCVWDIEDEIGGFYSVVRRHPAEALPIYKVGLAAVDPAHRSHGAQNQMQFWIFSNAPDAEWITVNSPALTNLSGLKNNIRAGKELSYVEAFLFWDQESGRK